MTLTFAILGVTLVLFIWDKIRPDLVALLALLALFGVGVVDTRTALSGFGDPAVVMIAALFVVGEGLSRSGVTAWVSQQVMVLAAGKPARLLVVMMLGTAFLSAFISNTGTVATLLPVVVGIAWSVQSLPSKYLMPLAFAANAGGLLTLTGTPPNIIVADSLQAQGFAPLGYFEFGLIGLPLLLITLGYMRLVGQRLLPDLSSDQAPVQVRTAVQGMAEVFMLQHKLYRLRVPEDSPLVGQTLESVALGRDHNVSVLRIIRPAAEEGRAQARRTLLGLEEEIPRAQSRLHAGDTLLVKATPEAVAQVAEEDGLPLEAIDVTQTDLPGLLLSPEIGVAEVLIVPRSAYIGQTVQGSRFSQKYGVQVLSIRRGNRLVTRRGSPLDAGDVLLVRGRWEDIELLRQEWRNFVVAGEPETMSRQLVSLNRRSLIATLSLLGMVILMVSGLMPTAMAALLTAVVMLLGGCLTTTQAYRAISWPSVVLIAAMIPLASALDQTGGAALIADTLVATLGQGGHYVLLGGVFLLTMILSQIISNTATAVLLSPIVMTTALGLELSPYPFMMAVAVGASTAFLTPIASTTNLMVMSPGGYAFRDYFRVGLPLTLLFLVVTLLLVPLIWPFAAS